MRRLRGTTTLVQTAPPRQRAEFMNYAPSFGKEQRPDHKANTECLYVPVDGFLGLSSKERQSPSTSQDIAAPCLHRVPSERSQT